ncbi:MAG: hypothetical protein ACREMS_13700 [Gemmatimonadaceae bacterium]
MRPTTGLLPFLFVVAPLHAQAAVSAPKYAIKHPGMYRGPVTSDGKITVKIYKD